MGDNPPADDQLHQVGRGQKRAAQKKIPGVDTCLPLEKGREGVSRFAGKPPVELDPSQGTTPINDGHILDTARSRAA